MIIFIGNLRAATKEKELCAHMRLPAGNHIRIFKKENGDGVLARYGLLYVKSDREGQKLIRRSQGTSFKGMTLEVREFGHRSASNERRRLDWREVPWDQPERRKGERRQRGIA